MMPRRTMIQALWGAGLALLALAGGLHYGPIFGVAVAGIGLIITAAIMAIE